MVMGRVRNWWSHSKTVAVIWFSSLALFFFLFQLALRNSTSLSSLPSDSAMANSNRRSTLYDKMERDLDQHGAAFLKHGETSQSLSLSDLFTLKNGFVTPVLKAAHPPVRANVLYMSTEYSVPISKAVKQVFDPYFDKAIWFQNSSLYHFSMFHASHHIAPVSASEIEIEDEAAAAKAVAEGLCPLEIVLDRVVLTSTGVLLGCWQVISGTDPVSIRAKLRTALPRAPEKQLYDEAILHTSFARLLSHPKASLMDTDSTSNPIKLFHKLVSQLNNEIRGFKKAWLWETFELILWKNNKRMASNLSILHHLFLVSMQFSHHRKYSSTGTFCYIVKEREHQICESSCTRHRISPTGKDMAKVKELWYVEEYDVLALALNGKMKVRRFQMGCSST
ncbi:uncharacterized protein [Gossypium hirsutum]|uniref:Uncharacterized protein isoform X2 n=1 Tax=Gossypium hirsutum TaxID=3635 RepID=A0A1U8NEI9_GOSHI|nr:uncharacterized protein LOC107946508 isoform X2 [Gossypium hirsutum]